MNKYKPEFMGKVLPADDPAKLTDFVTNKYDAFTMVYNTCKDQAENIETITTTSPPGNATADTLSIKISTDTNTLRKIQETANNFDTVTVSGDVVTARGN